MPVHVHVIGRKKQGPKVDDHIRCVSCGSSTRSRKYECCTLSDSDGGRICKSCIKKSPNKSLECNLWVPHSLSAFCCSCTSSREDLLNCYACERDVCIDCTEPLTLAFWFATGSMYILCTGCCPTDLFRCPETGEQQTDKSVDQFFCALCQSWHLGPRPESPELQCEECGFLPWDEPTPICKAAYDLRHRKINPQRSSPITKSPSATRPKTEKGPEESTQSELLIPILTLKETMLDLGGKLENICRRVGDLEGNHSKVPNPAPAQPNTKGTQTESESSLHPPACAEAVQLWEIYQTSKKSETQILIEALKSLDLKSLIENQNRHMNNQSAMLNNLNRSFSSLAKPNKNRNEPKEYKNNTNKSRNGSTSNKRSKKDE